MTRRTNTDPMRRVDDAVLMPMTSILASFKGYYWLLTLECGHEVERGVRYQPGHGRRGFALLHHPPGQAAILAAQERARCEVCARG